MNRISDKIQEIEKFLDELEILIPNTLEEYKTKIKEELINDINQFITEVNKWGKLL